MGVTGQVLDVLERNVLAEQIRDHQDAERVGREDLTISGLLEEVPKPEFIVQSVSEKVGEFLVEYLRVNEKDCPR